MSEDVIKSDGCIYAVLKEDFTYEGLYLKAGSCYGTISLMMF